MPTLAEIRQQFPEYGNVDDERLAKALHAKFYSEYPFENFAKAIGYSGPASRWATAGKSFAGGLGEGLLGTVEGPFVLKNYVQGTDPKQDSVLQKAGELRQQMHETLAVDPAQSQEFIAGTLPQAAGSMVSFFLPAGAFGKALKLAGAAPGLVNTATTLMSSALGASQSGAAGFRDALVNGASLETAYKASGLNALVGLSEGVPIARALDRLNQGTGGSLKRLVVEGLKGGGEEAIQEIFQGLSENKIAQELYAPDRSLTEGVLESGAAGGLLGAGLSALTTGIGGRQAARQKALYEQEQAAREAVQSPAPASELPPAEPPPGIPLDPREFQEPATGPLQGVPEPPPSAPMPGILVPPDEYQPAPAPTQPPPGIPSEPPPPPGEYESLWERQVPAPLSPMAQAMAQSQAEQQPAGAPPIPVGNWDQVTRPLQPERVSPMAAAMAGQPVAQPQGFPMRVTPVVQTVIPEPTQGPLAVALAQNEAIVRANLIGRQLAEQHSIQGEKLAEAEFVQPAASIQVPTVAAKTPAIPTTAPTATETITAPTVHPSTEQRKPLTELVQPVAEQGRPLTEQRGPLTEQAPLPSTAAPLTIADFNAALKADPSLGTNPQFIAGMRAAVAAQKAAKPVVTPKAPVGETQAPLPRVDGTQAKPSAPLADYLASTGGIAVSDRGETSMEGAQWMIPKAGPLWRAKAKGLDYARERAIEGGYLRRDATVEDLVRALDKDRAAWKAKDKAGRVYPGGEIVEDTGKAQDEEQYRLETRIEEVRAHSVEKGYELSDREMRSIAETMLTENMDASDATDRFIENDAEDVDAEHQDNVDQREGIPLEPFEEQPPADEGPTRQESRASDKEPGKTAVTEEPGAEGLPQLVLPGMERSAKQALAARDAAGPKAGQKPANEGLFAPKEKEQGELKIDKPDVQYAVADSANLLAAVGEHASDYTFDQFDFRRLGENTQSNITAKGLDNWAMRLARFGAWLSEDGSKVSDRTLMKNILQFDIPDPSMHFDSLDELAEFIEENGGPTKTRRMLRKDGHDVVSVDDEEFGVKSLILLDPRKATRIADALLALQQSAFTPAFARDRSAIVAEATKLAKQINPTVTLEAVDRILDISPQAFAASGGREGFEPIASYSPAQGLIRVALSLDDKALLSTAGHEAWHSIERMLPARDVALLNKSFPASGTRAQNEEVAYAFQDYLAGAPRGNLAARGVFARIKQFLQRLGNLLKGRGFQTVDDIFERALAGEYAPKMQTVDVRGTPVWGMPLGKEGAAISAWHGSPHRFDKFDFGKMGTGEGAQAYGAGGYFTDTQEIGQGYKEQLTKTAGMGGRGRNAIYSANGKDIPVSMQAESDIAHTMQQYGIDPKTKEGKDWLASEIGAKNMTASRDIDKAAVMRLFKGPKIERRMADGALYKVTLDVNPEDLLDWDKPLSEQSAKVREALEELGVSRVGQWRAPHPKDEDQVWHLVVGKRSAGEYYTRLSDGKFQARNGRRDIKVFSSEEEAKQFVEDGIPYDMIPKGESVYATLGSSRKASAALLAAGIPGIKYLDGTSRKAGEGTYNYVIFDDKLVSIDDVQYAVAPIDRPDFLYNTPDTGIMDRAMGVANGSAYQKLKSWWNNEFITSMIDQDQPWLQLGRRTMKAKPDFLYNLIAYARQDRGHTAAVIEGGHPVFDKNDLVMDLVPGTKGLLQIFNDGLLGKPGTREREADAVAAQAYRIVTRVERLLREDTANKAKVAQMRQSAAAREQKLKALPAAATAQEVAADQKDREFIQKLRSEAKMLEEMSNKARGFSKEDIKKYKNIPAEQKARFDKMWGEFNKFNDAVLQFGVDTGLFSQEAKDLWSSYQDWIPFYRAYEETGELIGPAEYQSGISNPKSGIKKLMGSELQIVDPFDGILRSTKAIIGAGQRNVALNAAAKAMETSNDGRFVRMDGPTDNTVLLYEDGVKKRFQIDDPTLVASLVSLGPRATNNLIKALTTAAAVYRFGVTAMPGFWIANPQRDIIGQQIQSGLAVSAKHNFFTELKDAYKGSFDINRVKAITGYGGSYYTTEGGLLGDSLSEKLGSKRVGAFKKSFRTLHDGVERMSNATETASRMAIYHNALKKGMSPKEAANEAFIASPFHRHGSNEFLRTMTQLLPFTNPRIQGLSRMFETQGVMPGSKERAVLRNKIWMRGLLLSMATAAIFASYSDDDWERYNQESVTNRANYHYIYPPGAERPIRIAKAFEFGTAFSSLPEAFVRAIRGTHPGELGKVLSNAVMNTFAFNPLPQAILPAIEVATNYDFFQKRDVEPRYLQRFLPEERATPTTSATASAIARTIPGGLSPIQIQHLVEGYLGTMGAYLLFGADSIFSTLGLQPEKPSGAFGPGVTGKALSLLVGRFTKASGVKPADVAIQEIYEMRTKADEAFTTARELMRRGETERAKEIMEENKAPLMLRKQLGQVTDNFARFSKAAQQIRYNKTMDADEKRRRIDEIESQKNAMARQYQTILRRVAA